MEVVVPTVHDFHFSSTASTPYVSAPSSPKGSSGDPFDFYRHYTSAPTSPTRAASIYAHFNSLSLEDDSGPISTSRRSLLPTATGVPFDWEETPGTPKSPRAGCDASLDDDGSTVDEFNFAFDFSGRLDENGRPAELTTADELFEKGRIRPLKPPPRLQYPAPKWDDVSTVAFSPRSPKSPKSPRSGALWSPRHHRGRCGGGDKGFDPFTAAMVETTRDRERGRISNASASMSYSRSRKGSRSLSPLRGHHHKSVPSSLPSQAAPPAAGNGTLKAGSGSKKWRLRDLLLFRSASEGRATGNRSKDPLRKYTLLSPSSNKKVTAEDLKNSSFRSTDSSGSFRRGSAVSPHELHYAANRAASEELKKKTPLPYRQGFFSCLRFNPAISSIARGFGHGYSSFNRGSS